MFFMVLSMKLLAAELRTDPLTSSLPAGKGTGDGYVKNTKKNIP